MSSETPLSPQVESRQQYPGIDIVKFLCSFLVIAIHIAPFSDAMTPSADALNFLLQKCLCRIAVPFFFTSSGFFLFRGMDADHLDVKKIEGYCFKLLRTLGLLTLLLFIGGTDHLWYLGAAVVAVVCVSLCFHWHLKYHWIACFSFILYCIGLLGDSYFGLLDMLRSITLIDFAWKGYAYFFSVTRNGLFFGFLFVFMGAVFAHKRIQLKPVPALLGFLASLALLIAEVYYLEGRSFCGDYNMFLSLIPLTFFVFALAASLKLPHHPLYKKLRVVGMLIYYLHMFVSSFVDVTFGVFLKFTGNDLYPFLFPSTAAAVVIAAFVIHSLSQREKFRWLTYLYQ